MCKCKNEKEKVRKNNARIYEKKSEKKRKTTQSIKRTKVCSYQENDFSF